MSLSLSFRLEHLSHTLHTQWRNNNSLAKTEGERTKHDIHEGRSTYSNPFITVLTEGAG